MFVVHITQLISVHKKAKLAMKERRVTNGTGKEVQMLMDRRRRREEQGAEE